jgi:hypothetical protein
MARLTMYMIRHINITPNPSLLVLVVTVVECVAVVGCLNESDACKLIVIRQVGGMINVTGENKQ